MNDTVLAATLVAATIVVLLIFRSRTSPARIALELLLLGAATAFLLGHGTSPLPATQIISSGVAAAWLRTLAVVWWLLGARIVVAAMVIARGRYPHSREARLFSDLIAGGIYVAAVLVILNSVLDLRVNGLIATSGIVAIVVGLALQNTLADVFSGVAVGLERPFQVGDRVSLDGGAEGVVAEINWRSIRLQTDSDDLATIPNSIVAKGQIINRSVPTRRRAGKVEIVTPASASPDVVLTLLRHAVLLCPTVLSAPAPVFALRRSGLRSAGYEVIFFVAESAHLDPAKSLLLRQARRLLRHAALDGSGMMTIAELLRSLALFDELSEDEAQSLATRAVMRRLEPGEIVFDQGDAGQTIYVVQAGVLGISRRHGEDVAELGRIGPGEYIGELGLITGQPRSVTMTATTHATVIEIDGTAITDLIGANPTLRVALERSVRRGLDLLERDEAARSHQPSEEPAALLKRIRAYFHL